jgi:hypothetical protein
MNTSLKKHNLFVIVAVLALSFIIGGLSSINPILSFILGFILITFIIFAKAPDLIALSAIFIIFTNAVVIAYKFHNFPFIISATLPVLILGVSVAYTIFVLRKPLVFDIPILLFLGYFAIGIFGTINSIDLMEGFNNLFVLISEGLLLYILIINSIRSSRELRNSIWAILVAAIIIGGLSAFQQTTGTFDNNYWGFAQVTGRGFDTGETALSGAVTQPRLEGHIGEKNYFAQIMLMVVPLGLFQFRTEKSKMWKILALLATAMAISATTLTFSRGVAVAFVILIVVMVFFRYISINQILILTAGIILVFLLFPQYATRLITIQDIFSIRSDGPGISSTDVATQGRIGEMYAAWLIFLDHPVVGVGPNMFKYHYQDSAERIGLKSHNEDRRAHNLFLEVAANNGFFGLIFFLSIPGYILFRLAKINKRWRQTDPALANMAIGLFLAIVSYLSTGLFLSLAYERFYWMILAISAAAVLISKEQEKNIALQETSLNHITLSPR